jgi:endoglucanase
MKIQNPLPQWRGFNLVELVRFSESRPPDGPWIITEDDFRWISDWGFDFLRIPVDYRFLLVSGKSYTFNEATCNRIDELLNLAERYHFHLSLNLHRVPGYCINLPMEEQNLWKEQEPLDLLCWLWAQLAQRYQQIPSSRMSFNLINEPHFIGYRGMAREDHERVIRAITASIRKVDRDRLIIIDGIDGGNLPSPELADLGVAQSCRAYLPMGISHYKAQWIDTKDWPDPVWPHPADPWSKGPFGKEELIRHYQQWLDLIPKGVGIHCGEGGCYKETPHDVFLTWFHSVLEILAANKVGFTLWNFRGHFGILDSERTDVDYEEWFGHKLDRRLLNLLQHF